MKAIVLGATDNVATTIDDLQVGDILTIRFSDRNTEVKIMEPVPFGHKVALSDIAQGGAVLKYDEIIGTATAAISRGQHVHVHNVISNRVNAQRRGPEKVEDGA